jgi:hypothetical protein
VSFWAKIIQLTNFSSSLSSFRLRTHITYYFLSYAIPCKAKERNCEKYIQRFIYSEHNDDDEGERGENKKEKKISFDK